MSTRTIHLPFCRSSFLPAALILIALTGCIHAQAPQFGLSVKWSLVKDAPFAKYVETADVNRDGIPDIISGNQYNTYVLYGRPQYPSKDTINLIYRGGMIRLLDYNGDGNKDMVAMEFSGPDSTGYLLFYMGQPAPALLFKDTPDYVVPIGYFRIKKSNYAICRYSEPVVVADFNGDAKEDMLIAAPDYDFDSVAAGYNYRGKYFLYIGKNIPTGIPDFAVAKPSNNQTEGKEGYWGNYHGAGDINGDGYDDLLIGTRFITRFPGPNGSEDSVYRLRIYHGGPNFTFTLDSFSRDYYSRIHLKKYWSEWFAFPFSVVDFNHDGIDDFCTRSYRNNGRDDHFFNVHYGGGEIDTVPNVRFTNFITGSGLSYSHSGIIWNCSDMNGDGWNDFVSKNDYVFRHLLLLGGPYAGNLNPIGTFQYYINNCKSVERAMQYYDIDNNGAMDALMNSSGGDYPYFYGGLHILAGKKDFTVGIADQPINLKADGDLNISAFPNPSNGGIRITCTVSQAGYVTATLYSMNGETVAELYGGWSEAGTLPIFIDPREQQLSSGLYLVRVIQNSPGAAQPQSGTVKISYVK